MDPAGDAAHMATHVTPHGAPVTRHLVRLRPGLSTAGPLEARAPDPSPLVEVTRYVVSPAGMPRVAGALEALRREARSGSLLPYTVYELGAGAGPGFMVMTWRTRLASFDEVARDPVQALRRHLRSAVEAAGGDPVKAVTSEVWRYRPDLTYLAQEGR